MKRLLSLLTPFALAGSLFTSGANAQAALVEIDDTAMLMPWNLSADAVEDMDVFGADGRKIGDVEEVIGSNATTPSALVVDFEDGAGFGDRDDVAVPLANFTVAGNRLTLNGDAAAIGAMPTWND